ncbi:MAG: hypothetical protein ACPLXC_02350 [Candidatus Pacearchaeota archaeon]
MLSDIVLLTDSLKVKILDNLLNKTLLINGHLFREDLNGWIYVGKLINKGKNSNAFNFYNKSFEMKPIHLDLGVNEKNFYPHCTLPKEVGQRLTELYEFYRNRDKKDVNYA